MWALLVRRYSLEITALKSQRKSPRQGLRYRSQSMIPIASGRIQPQSCGPRWHHTESDGCVNDLRV